MKDLGVFGTAIPAEYRGTPVSTACYVFITQQLARGWMSLVGAVGGHSVIAKLIREFGTEEQRQRLLPKMATGEFRATMALTEPGGGSDLQALRTTARRDGDDYVVNGSKMWITNARHSQVIALLCKTDPEVRQAGTVLHGSRYLRTAEHHGHETGRHPGDNDIDFAGLRIRRMGMHSSSGARTRR